MSWPRRGKATTWKAASHFWMRWCSRILVLSMCISCGLLYKHFADSFTGYQGDTPVFRARHLLSGTEWEKCDFEIEHARNYSNRDSWYAPNIAYAWLALYIFSILVIFVAIAIVCDDFFVPSLEAISEKLELSEDVAGATFMAAGSSAPELFTSVAGVTVESDVGVGTIVGSAVFNLLIIIALTAALAGNVLQLDWRPLLRDSFCYALSIAMFVWFAWDGMFYLHEAIILLVLYILYIVLMKFNSKLMDLLGSFGPKVSQVSPQPTEVTQFVSGDGNESLVETNGALQGEHGTPAGKLPPIKSSESNAGEHPSHTDVKTAEPVAEGHETPTGQAKLFSHAHKGELSRSFNNLSLGKSQHPQPSFLPRLSFSYPILRDVPDDPKAHRRSSVGFIHGHAPVDGVRLKSVATQQVLKEYRRRSEIAQREKEQQQLEQVTVVQVDSNGKAVVIPPNQDTNSLTKNASNDQEENPKMVICPCLPAVAAEIPEYPDGGMTCLSTCRYLLGWLLFVVSFPFICMFTWTIPDCSEKHNRKYFLLSFFMSIVWIAILSLGMVTLVGRSGCILSVDKFTMGLVVIAIGTSVPDALSSVLVARDGFGDMAVSNAIGSNVFDINLGLGLPFLIRILLTHMEPIQLLSNEEKDLLESLSIPILPHVKFGFILLFILVVALLIFLACRFQLKRKVGVSFVVMYVLFVAYAYIQDIYCDHKC